MSNDETSKPPAWECVHRMDEVVSNSTKAPRMPSVRPLRSCGKPDEMGVFHVPWAIERVPKEE